MPVAIEMEAIIIIILMKHKPFFIVGITLIISGYS